MSRRQSSRAVLVQNRRSGKSSNEWERVHRKLLIPGENYCAVSRGGIKERGNQEDWSHFCGKMCVPRHMMGGEKFTDRFVHSKGSLGLWMLGVDVRSLRIPLDLGGIGSTDGTGSICLEETKNKKWGEEFSTNPETNPDPDCGSQDLFEGASNPHKLKIQILRMFPVPPGITMCLHNHLEWPLDQITQCICKIHTNIFPFVKIRCVVVF